MQMEVFFYGLFMDQKLLAAKNIEPMNPRKGHLNDYRLGIGNRASLVPSEGEQAYGVVMTVDDEVIAQLYSEASVADYLPEEVTITLDNFETVQATCYNLPPELLTGTNEEYASKLLSVAREKGFPEAYIEKIQRMVESSGP